MTSEQRKYIIIANACFYYVKNSSDELFMANLEPLCYIDLKNPTIIKKLKSSNTFSLCWYVSAENIEQFKQYGIYKVLVEEKIFTGVRDTYRLNFIVDHSVTEVENQLLQEFLDNNINVEDGLKIESIEKIKEIVLNSKSWETKFRNALTEEYFEAAKEYFEEDEQNMTKEEFTEYFILESFFIDESGEFTSTFNSKMYLPDHTIYINGTLDEGIVSIYLEG